MKEEMRRIRKMRGSGMEKEDNSENKKENEGERDREYESKNTKVRELVRVIV